ncbi:hypothetical protein DFQ26_008192 [Actinomortierella ambigua]|nr:hypothetical protein DFQ26_008192 [Actinomortierella ambigua]
MIGANAAYSKERFYRKSFDADQARVNGLFENATSSNIRIIEMMLPLDDFRRFLSCGQYAMVVLVNMRLLRCSNCVEQTAMCSCNTGPLGAVVQQMRGYRYVGHFIVLVQYDPSTDEFYYRDPGVNDDLCVISAKDLEKARRSSGTDHDCIVVRVV